MALWKRNSTWWADVTVHGSRHWRSLKTGDRREARALEQKLVARIQDGKVAVLKGKAFGRLPFSAAARQYLAEREKLVSERTMQFERECLVPLKKYFA